MSPATPSASQDYRMMKDGKTEVVTSTEPEYTLPDSSVLESASNLLILDSDNKSHPFKFLYTPLSPGHACIIVFIRHFFCTSCSDYIRHLCSLFPTSRLTAENLSIKIVACGQPALVSDYKARTGCAFEIYCDPSLKLYDVLGMKKNLALGPTTPQYVQSGAVKGTLDGMWNLLKAGWQAPKGGPYDQNGGEMVFVGVDSKQQAEGKLVWCHRMKHTRDHAEVKELEEVLERARAG